MTDDHTDDSETRVTRRAAMGGGAAAAATMMGLATGTASAQQGTEPRIQLGDDWEIDDVDRGDGTTDLELRHLPSGSTFVFDGDSQTATLPELVTDEVRGGVTGGNAVTNLFGDGLEYASGAVRVLSSIWDSANQVITADVDNSSVVTESVSTEELRTTPTGIRLTKDSDQTVPSGSRTEVTWQSANEFNPNADSFADLPNNAITVPNNEVTMARLTVALRTNNAIAWEYCQPQMNGSGFDGGGQMQMGGSTWQATVFKTSWVNVSSGDSFTVDFRHSAGSDEDISSFDNSVFIALDAV